MNPSRVSGLLVCFLIPLCPGSSPAQTEEEVELVTSILNQRADFQIVGRAVDQDGAPLPSVRLEIDVRRFDPDSLKAAGKVRHQDLADGRFEIHQANATALLLRAGKPGYLDAHWQIRYLDLVRAREEELGRRLAEGDLDRETFEKQRPHYFADLKGIETNLVLVLERLEGAPAWKPATLPVMVVSTNAPESACALFPDDDDGSPRSDLRLVMKERPLSNRQPMWELELQAGTGGGIQTAAAEKLFDKLHRAPVDGYQSSIPVPVPRRHSSIIFFLKTSEGYYAKVHGLVSRKRGGRDIVFEVFDAAIQTLGSRVLVVSDTTPETGPERE